MINIKIILKKVFLYVKIMFQLHSKAPTKEIKRLWEIVALSLAPVTILELFSGDKILGFIQTPKIQFVQDYGCFIFFAFVIVFCIAFFDVKKCKEITLEIKNSQNVANLKYKDKKLNA